LVEPCWTSCSGYARAPPCERVCEWGRAPRETNNAVTVNQQVAAARIRLRQSGIPGAVADLDARLLAEFALGWTTERLLVSGTEDEPTGFTDRYQELVDRRARREPLAYIVGQREFW